MLGREIRNWIAEYGCIHRGQCSVSSIGGNMDFGTAKLLLVFGGTIFWCIFELWRVRRKPRR